jgi:hypothetical protein
MISVIVLSKHPEAQSIQERNIIKTVGMPHEYLLIDGTSGVSTAAAYNYAVEHAKGNHLVFIPDDVYFMKENWGALLERKFLNDNSIGCIGVAGTQYLFHDKPSLTAAGRPFIKGRVVHHLQNGDFFAAVFSNENGDFDVVACDGVFMAVRSSLMQACGFDDNTFDGHSFYDLDLCMQITQTHRIIVTTDILVKRRSQPVFDSDWQCYGRRFLEKYSNYLPICCTDLTPDPGRFQPSQFINLKGKFSSETIC